MKWILTLAVVLTGLAAAFGGSSAAGAQAPALIDTAAIAPRTVILVRHAETVSEEAGGRDRWLSDAGKERAAALAKLLASSGVTHLFTSEFRRTHETLAPLAQALELEPRAVDAGSPDAQVAALDELPPGSVAVVCGHSNTVPGLVRALGGDAQRLVEHPRYGAMLDHDEFGRLFVVWRAAKGDVSALELAYGE